jgi:hypothetical protein
MALQPFVGPWLLLQFRYAFYAHGRPPWTSDQSVATPLPTHGTAQTQIKRTHRYPCLERDSNPWSQRSSDRKQFMPQTARPLRSAIAKNTGGKYTEYFFCNFAYTKHGAPWIAISMDFIRGPLLTPFRRAGNFFQIERQIIEDAWTTSQIIIPVYIAVPSLRLLHIVLEKYLVVIELRWGL